MADHCASGAPPACSPSGKWSFQGDSGEVSLEVTGTETYAGIEGYAGVWPMKGHDRDRG